MFPELFTWELCGLYKLDRTKVLWDFNIQYIIIVCKNKNV